MNDLSLVSLRFSWVVPRMLAGCRGPISREELHILKEQGIRALVRLMERHENPFHSHELHKEGIVDFHEPVPDTRAPTMEQALRVLAFIDRSFKQDHAVAVACYGGRGRTGTILGCYLIRQGMDSHEAIKHLRDLRPGSVETREQVDFLREFERQMNGNGMQDAP